MTKEEEVRLETRYNELLALYKDFYKEELDMPEYCKLIYWTLANKRINEYCKLIYWARINKEIPHKRALSMLNRKAREWGYTKFAFWLNGIQ